MGQSFKKGEEGGSATADAGTGRGRGFLPQSEPAEKNNSGKREPSNGGGGRGSELSEKNFVMRGVKKINLEESKKKGNVLRGKLVESQPSFQMF